MEERCHRPTVALETLGCKLNQAETGELARQFAAAGYRQVSPAEAADIYILNTCTVTHVADGKARHRLRLAHRRHPRGLLVATGCYAQRAPGELTRIAGVGLVVGNEDKPRLLPLVEAALDASQVGGDHGDLSAASGPVFHTRALVKVQDGCTRGCSYCIVPRVRGRERSLPVTDIVDQVQLRLVQGYQDITLTGTEIGAYQDDATDIKGLIERILKQTGVTRLRVSSLQPPEITPELAALWQDNRLCRHFHLSLQSGSDTVLRRMGRGYTADRYREAVAMLREAVPGVAITTDVIVGFPGETETEFEEGYRFCQELGFARIHVFPYSPRPGTVAANMLQQVGDRVKKRRCRRMLALADESRVGFYRCFIGSMVTVLWEQPTDGIWSGLTDNYIPVYTRSDRDLTNHLLPVKLVGLRGDGVWAELEE